MALKGVGQIEHERELIITLIKGTLGEEFEVIDSIIEPPENTTNRALWCLGRSFELLSEADFAVFSKGWQTARGCWMEHEACIRYGIPIIYI